MHDSKSHIIEKVLPLFINNGFNGVSITDILKEIALSRGAFYYHFTSKEQCFEECVKHFIATARVTLAVQESISLREYIDIYIKKISIRVNSHTALERVGFINEAIRIIPNFLDYFSKMHTEEVRAWSTVIARAIETGEIKKTIPAEEIAKLFIYQCDGLVMNSSTRKDTAGLDGEIKKTWETFYSLLKQ